MGWGDSGDHLVTAVQVELRCRQLVGELTAMPDPTAGGDLSIQIGVEEGNRALLSATRRFRPTHVFVRRYHDRQPHTPRQPARIGATARPWA